MLLRSGRKRFNSAETKKHCLKLRSGRLATEKAQHTTTFELFKAHKAPIPPDAWWDGVQVREPSISA